MTEREVMMRNQGVSARSNVSEVSIAASRLVDIQEMVERPGLAINDVARSPSKWVGDVIRAGMMVFERYGHYGNVGGSKGKIQAERRDWGRNCGPGDSEYWNSGLLRSHSSAFSSYTQYGFPERKLNCLCDNVLIVCHVSSISRATRGVDFYHLCLTAPVDRHMVRRPQSPYSSVLHDKPI